MGHGTGGGAFSRPLILKRSETAPRWKQEQQQNNNVWSKNVDYK